MQPVYVSGGLAWEEAEEARVARLLAASAYGSRVDPLVRVEQPVTDVYAQTHWAVRGTPPAYNTPDSDVYLVGRNVLLLSKSAVYCALHGISKIAVGPLAGNPFPDATPEFFAALGHALSLGLDHAIEITAPFAQLGKPDVIRIGAELGVPWELTLSCMSPAGRGALRALQQVPRAAAGLRRGRRRGPGAVRLAAGERRDRPITAGDQERAACAWRFSSARSSSRRPISPLRSRRPCAEPTTYSHSSGNAMVASQ